MKHEHEIGSCIRSLSFLVGEGGFFEELARNAHRIALTRLGLCDLYAEECLWELDLYGVDNADLILCSLRSTGALHHLTMQNVEWEPVHKFCLHNKLGRLTGSMKRRHAKSLLPTLLKSAKYITAIRIHRSLCIAGTWRFGWTDPTRGYREIATAFSNCCEQT
jgi:hypothetical protein